jgi:hypothetical protein
MSRVARHEIIACLDDAVTRLRNILDIIELASEGRGRARCLYPPDISAIQRLAGGKIKSFEAFTKELRQTE